MKGTLSKLGPTLVVLIALGLALAALRRPQLWAGIGVPRIDYAFADTRVITGGWNSRRQGHDPMRENPGDPWKRVMNYPRFWELPGLLGMRDAQWPALAAFLWVAFFAATWIVLRQASCWGWLLALPLLCSPATALALQRANIDLLMFALLVLAAVSVSARPGMAGGLVFAGFLLKMSPGAAAPILLRGKRGWALLGMLGALMALAALVQWKDILLMRSGTSEDPSTSFGVDCLLLAKNRAIMGTRPVVIAQNLFLLAPLAVGAAIGWWKGPSPLPAGPARLLWLTGGLLYASSYAVLKTNYDYRLIFLLACVPWLVSPEHRLPWAFRFGMWMLMLVSMWNDFWELRDSFFGYDFAGAFTYIQMGEGLLYWILAGSAAREFFPDVIGLFRRQPSSA